MMQKLFAFKSHYQKIKDFFIRYERLLMPATLILGFLVDYITFTNIQISITLILLLIYWFIGGVSIIVIKLYDAEKLSRKFRYVRLVAPLLIQFTFGALLGGSFIFYWFSGTISVSWPFILIIAVLMFSNDVFRHNFQKPLVQLSVYFFITLSLFSIVLPFFFNSLNPALFVLAGLLSLALFYLYIKILSHIKEFTKEQKDHFFILSFSIFMIMNFFYFSNIIPPIPLSLREAGVYHSVQRSGGGYVLRGEAENFWQKIIPGQTIHLTQGESAYVYTAIFAPGELRTTIVHRWQYYDEDQKTWVDKDRLSFTVTGGRKEGFRGYSTKSSLLAGKWRVYVETPRGQVLGRKRFNVERVTGQEMFPEIVRYK